MGRQLPNTARCPYCERKVDEHCPNPACHWFACRCGAYGPEDNFIPFTQEQVEKQP